MRQYVFGTHEGEFPTQLVSGDDTGKIWAAAPLEGPLYNAFFAMEGPTQHALDLQADKITSSGVKPQDTLGLCLDPSCLIIVDPGKTPPCDLIEHFLEVIFCILEGHEPIGGLIRQLHEIAGANCVAAAYNGDGRIVLEVGVNHADTSAAVRKLIEDNDYAKLSSMHIARTVHRLG